MVFCLLLHDEKKIETRSISEIYFHALASLQVLNQLVRIAIPLE